MDDREQAFVKSKELEAKIKALHEQVVGKVPDRLDRQGAGLAVTIMSDLLGGLIAGGVIGFLIQRFFDTKPFIVGIFIFLGGIAGLLNVYKYVRRIENGKNK